MVTQSVCTPVRKAANHEQTGNSPSSCESAG